ncbi:hypothetical protein F7725_004011 [Dissostichus mawsoni]|uniref:Ig-like domain-containing protein n=1 Tax=Dissostichus mawsoni TaxID=36200 RepID=A0A7J5YCT7_DISMA|nr:hypothetical protein F7725_004011 [Dissostichus mawsoni]
MDNDRGRYQVVKKSALPCRPRSSIVHCLVMNQQQCVSSHPAQFVLNTEYYRSVEETAVLQCPVTDLSEEEPPYWELNPVTKNNGTSLWVSGPKYSLVLHRRTEPKERTFVVDLRTTHFRRHRRVLVCSLTNIMFVFNQNRPEAQRPLWGSLHLLRSEMLSAQCSAADALCCCSHCEPEDQNTGHLICICSFQFTLSSSYEVSSVSVCTTLTRKPPSRMAAVSELSVLLTHHHPRGKRLFHLQLPEEASSCLISRFVGEEKLVLWNTSDLWNQNSSVPEDLKQRLVSMANTSSYMIQNLTHSDSGLYQEECWTEGQVTYEKKITITVCGSIGETRFPRIDGETMDLPCLGAADNLDVQWLKQDSRYEQEIWTRVFGDNTASVMDNDRGRYQVVKYTSALRISNISTTVFRLYTCLVMNQQQCVSSHPAQFLLKTERIFHSVEETAVLQCPVTDFSEDKPPYWETRSLNIDDQEQHNHSVGVVDQSYSLVFTSVTLNHSAMYTCKTFTTVKTYMLVLFSGGEEVTVRCKDWEKGWDHVWFFKSSRNKGRSSSVYFDPIRSNVRRRPDGRLVISNVSLQDTGEYWCPVLDEDQCLFSTKTVLKHRDPFGVHSTFYAVRCSALSVLLLMLCVVVVTVNLRTRTRDT